MKKIILTIIIGIGMVFLSACSKEDIVKSKSEIMIDKLKVKKMPFSFFTFNDLYNSSNHSKWSYNEYGNIVSLKVDVNVSIDQGSRVDEMINSYEYDVVILNNTIQKVNIKMLIDNKIPGHIDESLKFIAEFKDSKWKAKGINLVTGKSNYISEDNIKSVIGRYQDIVMIVLARKNGRELKIPKDETGVTKNEQIDASESYNKKDIKTTKGLQTGRYYQCYSSDGSKISFEGIIIADDKSNINIDNMESSNIFYKKFINKDLIYLSPNKDVLEVDWSKKLLKYNNELYQCKE